MQNLSAMIKVAELALALDAAELNAKAALRCYYDRANEFELDSGEQMDRKRIEAHRAEESHQAREHWANGGEAEDFRHKPSDPLVVDYLQYVDQEYQALNDAKRIARNLRKRLQNACRAARKPA